MCFQIGFRACESAQAIGPSYASPPLVYTRYLSYDVVEGRAATASGVVYSLTVLGLVGSVRAVGTAALSSC